MLNFCVDGKASDRLYLNTKEDVRVCLSRNTSRVNTGLCELWMIAPDKHR